MCNRAIGTNRSAMHPDAEECPRWQLVTPWVRLIESLVQLEVVILFMMFLWKVHSRHILTKTFIFFQAEISLAVPAQLVAPKTAIRQWAQAALESVIPNFYFQPTTMDRTEGENVGIPTLVTSETPPNGWRMVLEVFNFD